MFRPTPIARLTFGLVMLTVSILLLADLVGVVPDGRRAELEARRVIAESLAVQLSAAVTAGRAQVAQQTLDALVRRNSSVLSAGLRRADGTMLVDVADHARHWTGNDDGSSEPTAVQVPVYDSGSRWGAVEVRFAPLGGGVWGGPFGASLISIVAFTALAGCLLYGIFLRRALRELDPSAVIPERVRAALDALAEGLLILDDRERIVFANSAFAGKLGCSVQLLTGRDSSELSWGLDVPGDAALPWVRVLRGERLTTGVHVRLTTPLGEQRSFVVNASAIDGGMHKVRGVLATFDDVTEMERKHRELADAMRQIEQNQREITRQNRELQVLATRDPLTGILNRRSLVEGMRTLFEEARAAGDALACVMIDIDRFKSFNDRFGHATGDKVIRYVARCLTEAARATDLVGRYGGEEFCVVLPGADADEAESIAERMRLAIHRGEGVKVTSAVRITASFGVAVLGPDVARHEELMERADVAMYAAKSAGRNRTLRWTEAIGAEFGHRDHAPAAPQDADREAGIEQLRARIVELEGALMANSGALANTTGDAPDTRTLLVDRVQQALLRAGRYATRVGVIVFELDPTRRVEGTLGFTVMERLIESVLARIRNQVRRTDTVMVSSERGPVMAMSRINAHESALVVTDLKDPDAVTWVVRRLLEALKVPFSVMGHEIYAQARVGISLYPLDSEDAETLLRQATAAMRESRPEEGLSYQFYSSAFDRKAREQMRLENELRRAVAAQEFVLHYQPKVDLRSGVVTGLEALVRWQHPQRGLVPPGEFIPVAEQSGIIEQLGSWVLRSACLQARLWLESGHGPLSVSVNLSPAQFRQPTLAQDIIDILAETGLAPAALEVEVTESVVVQNMERAVDTMQTLHEAGVRISMDDFGTGYSSLSYLKRFPLDTLKIDRSFLKDCTQDSYDATILSAIIAMAHSLGLRVVAEGVETEGQMRFLQDLHCDEIQGYLIRRPVPREEVARLFAERDTVRRQVRPGVHLQGSDAVGEAPELFGILNSAALVEYRARAVTH